MIAYDDVLRQTIAANISRHKRRSHTLDGRRHAAVAIVLVDSDAWIDDDDEPDQLTEAELGIVTGELADLTPRMGGVAGGAAFLLCRRASKMRAHPGQFALPGGRCDAGETVVDTALRELHEELGLELTPAALLGVLDDYPTRSGFVITPVVLWAGGDPELHENPEEVAHTYRIGLHELCREDSPRFIEIVESQNPVVQVPLGGQLVHAPTGAVLVQFRWVALEGRIGERVDSFEQPTFAWR